MRTTLALGLVGLLMLALPGGGAVAGEEDSARSQAIQALKVRMEAKVREAELLESAGRTDEALAAFREVGEIYERGLERISRLFGGRPSARPSRRVLGTPQRRIEPMPDRPDRPDAPEPNRADIETGLSQALHWLTAHQSPNGGWNAATFMRWCNGQPRSPETRASAPDGAGKALYDVGVTGMATLALLKGGIDPRGQAPRSQSIRKALQYLRNVQDPEGCYGPRATQQYIYNHGMASLAMVEAYIRTQDQTLRASAQKGLDFTALARNPYFAWRYGIKPGDNDTSITGWLAAAIHRAVEGNKTLPENQRLAVDPNALKGALAWVEKITDPDFGRGGYLTRGTGSARPQELLDRFPANRTEAMTSSAILIRLWNGQTAASHDVIRKGAELVLRTHPWWNLDTGDIDMYAWLLGTHAMKGVGGLAWKTWRNEACQALLKNQSKEGNACDSRGSWPPVGPWGPDGGRVYATAIGALILAECRDQ